MRIWVAVLLASFVAYALKLSGYLVPARLRFDAKGLALMPAALLAALVVVQAATSGKHLVADARLLGLAVAAVALLLRAPFAVVVVLAAVAAAVARAAGAT